MKIHRDWDTPAFTLPPLAPRVGPFVSRPLLEVWWAHRGAKRGRLMLVESDTALLPLYRDERGVMFLGEEHLTDYHTPLGSDVAALVTEFAGAMAQGTPYRFDSLPEEAATVVAKGLADAGLEAAPIQHEVTAVLELPASFSEWLAGIGKKERHEVRRKRRRFESLLGPARIEDRAGRDAVERFADMHRRSAGDKGTFMDHVMAALFTDLHLSAGGRITFLLDGEATPVAAAFAFEDADGYYLYNSAFEPDAAAASPGIVLLAMLVERAIERGLGVFDFLKGDEAYKFKHGAVARPLYVIEGAVP